MEIGQVTRVKKRKSILSHTQIVLLYAAFVAIVMLAGIFIVCFTSTRSRQSCQLTLKLLGANSINLNSKPRSVAVGHFNKDNHTDIVVANSGTNTIGIYFSYNNGTLGDEQTYPTGPYSSPYSVAVSDFNNDNYADIAVANYGTNNIGIFIGCNNGTFDNQILFSIGSSRPLFITTADFNNDNQSDIAVANNGTNSIGILLGYGNSSFHTITTYSTGYDSRPCSLAIGDFNNDHYLDIAVANYGTDNIGIFIGYGKGIFKSQTIYSTGLNSNPSSIVVADLNSDNKLDILVANYGADNVGIFYGYKNGTFSVQDVYSAKFNFRPQYITIGNFNDSKQLGVVVVDTDNDRVDLLLGYNNGTFSTITTYDVISGSLPFSAAIADFNHDNQSDIIVVNYATNEVLLLSGYSANPSARQTNYPVMPNAGPTSLVINRFDNDNRFYIISNGVVDGILVLSGSDDGDFIPEANYSTGNLSAPHFIGIADLNNDNRTDIVSANTGTDSVGVLLGRDNGTFAEVVTYSTSTGSKPWWAAFGDVNNDNYLDIITANSFTDNIGILIGYGNGTFSNVKTYYIGDNAIPRGVAVGDIDNDNQLDIITADSGSNTVSILQRSSNGAFIVTESYPTGRNSNPSSIVLADFDCDNKLDIVVANTYTDSIFVFLGRGNGTYKTRTLYSTGLGSQPYSVLVADFNYDGIYDIAATLFGTNAIALFFGYENGSFQLARNDSTGDSSHPIGIAVADFNNDNQLEIVTTLWSTNAIAILTEYYAAMFSGQTIYQTGSARNPYSVVIDDINNDSRLDIVVADSGTNNIAVFLGLGNGSFETPTTYSTGIDSRPHSVTIGDINNDNHKEIIVANSESNTVIVFTGFSNGTFPIQQTYSIPAGSNPSGIVVEDINRDNRSDIVLVNKGTDSIGILLGFEYTSFEISETYPNLGFSKSYSVVVHDFNNDSCLDMAVALPQINCIAVRLGYCNGSFGNSMTYRTGYNSFPIVLTVGDLNNDDQCDIIVANAVSDNVGIFLGYGNGRFAPMVAISTGIDSNPLAVIVADFNKDNALDIAVANSQNDNIGILLGYGNGNFTTITAYSTGSNSVPIAVTVGDFNNDNWPDIVAVNQNNNNIGIFLGYGNGSFTDQVIYSTSYQSAPYWAAVGDFNGDNQTDIATANLNGNNVGIFLGNGNGTFKNVKTYSTGDDSAPSYVAVADFNHDNILDIAVCNFVSNSIVILFGFGDGAFLLGTPYSTGFGSGPSGLDFGHFNNDSQLDIAVANSESLNVVIFLANGTEDFGTTAYYSTGSGSQPQSIAIGDFNDDGRSDLVVANYGTDNVGILLNGGDGIFGTMIEYSTGVGSSPYSIAVGDFNNDNQSDLVVTYSKSNYLTILLGYGNGTFYTAATYSSGPRSRPYTVTIADFNNDNISDVVVANSGTNNIFLLHGLGNGSFGGEQMYALGYGSDPYSVAAKDLNGDGWTDIVVACYGADNVEIFMKTC